ncbi:CheY-like chemotaxis protein [Massilia sp. UYP11]|uniref:response regulator n=1 Tax=Massilia sp. UYP11 TaxID=1756385 RepID=UPI003D255F2A
MNHDILVVDDNEMIRYLLERSLRAAGHRVRVAANGVEALALCETMHFDVLLTDLNMPLMNGDALIARARALQPGLRCILLSADEVPPQPLGDGVTCLTKPLSRKELAALVARAGGDTSLP